MAQRPIDAKAAERCASIVGAKQKGDEPPPSRVSVTDVGMSSFPQNTTGPAGCEEGVTVPTWLGACSACLCGGTALTPGTDGQE